METVRTKRNILSVFSAGLILWLVMLGIQANASADPIKQCVAGIGSVKSFAVLFRLDILQFDGSDGSKNGGNSGTVVGSLTNRDTFADGLGRRIESNIGQAQTHYIGVITWNQIRSSKKALPQAISTSLPGLNYYDYLNPSEGQVFLKDLLSDSKTRITPLDNGPTRGAGPNVAGFEVNNPRFENKLQIWLDGDHGFMPAIVEFYERGEKGNYALTRRIRVEKFLQIDGGGWVPSIASNSRIMPGDATSTPYSGQRIEIYPESSSWNSIHDATPFLEKNLTNRNFSMNGWTYYCGPELLDSWQRAKSLMTPRPASVTVRIILIFILVVPPLVMVLRLMNKERKHV